VVIVSSQGPVHNHTAVAIEYAAEIVECAAEVEIGDVNVPVLMDRGGLFKALAFRGGFDLPGIEQPRAFQHPIHGAWRTGNTVLIDHAVAQPPVTLQRMLPAKGDDRLAFPGLQPMTARDLTVMPIRLALTALPVVVFARCKP
jgi:hypothetical protein